MKGRLTNQSDISWISKRWTLQACLHTKDERSVEEKVCNEENLFRHSLRILAVRWEWEI
jgi:hypothetical protein